MSVLPFAPVGPNDALTPILWSGRASRWPCREQAAQGLREDVPAGDGVCMASGAAQNTVKEFSLPR